MQIEKLWKLKGFHGFFVFYRSQKAAKVLTFACAYCIMPLQTATVRIKICN